MLQISPEWTSSVPSSLPGETLVLSVTGARRPTFRIEAAAGYRLRFVAGDRPFLWARIGSYWDEAWLIRARTPPDPLLPPLRAAEAREVKHEPRSALWWRTWALRAMAALGEGSAVFSNGTWCIGQVPLVTPDKAWSYPCSPWGYTEDANLPPAYVPEGGLCCSGYVEQSWNRWEHTPTGELFPLRELGAGDEGRGHAWRKHARDGSLPPVILSYVRHLGKYMILDGHVRLAAALEEGVAPPLLATWPAREHTTCLADDVRERVFQSLDLPTTMPPEQRVEVMNRLLQSVFATKTAYLHRPQAWPLRGSAAAWRDEVARRLRELHVERDEVERALESA